MDDLVDRIYYSHNDLRFFVFIMSTSIRGLSDKCVRQTKGTSGQCPLLRGFIVSDNLVKFCPTYFNNV